jgi:hypothetical protein
MGAKGVHEREGGDGVGGGWTYVSGHRTVPQSTKQERFLEIFIDCAMARVQLRL